MSSNSGTPGQGGSLLFDSLPPRLRAALREFPIEMDAGFALKMIKNGMSEDKLLQMLEQRKQTLSEFNPENRKKELGE